MRDSGDFNCSRDAEDPNQRQCVDDYRTPEPEVLPFEKIVLEAAVMLEVVSFRSFMHYQ